jgi:hypothetical protein
MRPMATILCLMVLLPLTGCEGFGKRFMFGTSAPTTTPGHAPAREELVKYLNDNSERVQSLRCLNIEASIQGYGFKAKMMAMKPRNFYLSATAVTQPIVDLGSNDKEFWFWSSKSPEPYQFFCTYKDFEEGKVANFRFPFQPEWIIEAMGMGAYGPADKYTVEADTKTVRLIEKTRTPQGQAVRKVIVMNKNPVSAPTPQVQAFLLLDDATGKEICSAHVQATEKGKSSAMIPRRLELRVEDGSKLSLVFDAIDVNPRLEASQFERQPMRGIQSVDLARPVGGR